MGNPTFGCLVAATALVAGLAAPARAELPAPDARPAWDPGGVKAPESGDEGVLLLRDGTQLNGRVVDGRGRVVLRTEELEYRFFARDDVLGIVTREMPPDGSGHDVKVVLRDGRVWVGRRQEAPAGGVAVRRDGAVRHASTAEVFAVLRARAVSNTLDAGPRQLAAPSAVLLRAGELQLTARSLELAAAIGILPFLDAEVSTTAPVLYAEPYGTNVAASLRGGLPLVRGLHGAAGLHVEVGASGRSLVFASGTLTWRGPRLDLTAHAGPTFAAARLEGAMGEVGFSLGSTWRARHGLDLIVEGWSSRGHDGPAGAVLAAGRMHRGRGALDLGVAWFPATSSFMPWFGLIIDPTPWAVEVR